MKAKDFFTKGAVGVLLQCGIHAKDDIEVSISGGVLTVRKRLTPRQAWIEKWYKIYNENKIGYHSYDDFTIVRVKRDGSTRIGAARCMEGDYYSVRTGIAVATARAYGEKIPRFI